MQIGRGRLKVRNLDRVAGFYQDVLGLRPLSQGQGRMLLGTSTTPLLELTGDPGLQPRNSRDAGLFHMAFLLPGRTYLGRWLAFALSGTADRAVLADPWGTRIELAPAQA